MVAPTWRTADISAPPEALRSAVNAPTAAFIAAGIAIPRPRPVTAIHRAAKPVDEPRPVKAPIASPAAITRKPTVTASLAVTRGSPRPPAGRLGAVGRLRAPR